MKRLILTTFFALSAINIVIPIHANQTPAIEIPGNRTTEIKVYVVYFQNGVAGRRTATVRLNENGEPISATVNGDSGRVSRWGRPAPNGTKYAYAFVADGKQWYFNL